MVVRLVVFDGVEYAEEAVDDLIGEDIFLYFNPFCLRVELGGADGRVDRTVDGFAV